VHFEIAYNGDRIIEINVSTDPSQVVDISEDVVKVRPSSCRTAFSRMSELRYHAQSAEPLTCTPPVVTSKPAGSSDVLSRVHGLCAVLE